MFRVFGVFGKSAEDAEASIVSNSYIGSAGPVRPRALGPHGPFGALGPSRAPPGRAFLGSLGP